MGQGRETSYRMVNAIGRGLLRALDLRVSWEGVENLPTSGPVILAANHVSYPDFVFIERAAISQGRYVRFMTRHDAWNFPVARPFMRAMQHIPVDRTAPAHAYLVARRLLRGGEAIGIFPEAGISYSFTVRPLMRGAAALARETGAPIVPVAIWGSQRVFTVGTPEPPPSFTRGRRIDLLFGAPLQASDDPTATTHLIGRTLTSMLEELQQRPHHQPRPGEVATWHPAHLGGAAPTRLQALDHDVVPRSAVRPSWGPEPHVFG